MDEWVSYEKKTELKSEDVEKISCAIDRARRMGVDVEDSNNVILFLENEIISYRQQIDCIQKAYNEIRKERSDDSLKKRLNDTFGINEFRIEPINPVSDLLKALSENGYNNISINAYKTNESEGE